MSALRKENPSNTEQVSRDLEERHRNFSRPEVVADPADRRPPQSVTPAAHPQTTENALPDRTASTPSAQRPPTAGEPEPRLPSTTSRETEGKQSPSADGHGPLFDEQALRDFRSRWDQVQTSFVDEPRRAVEQADALVAAVIKRISDQFAEERTRLEQAGGSEPSGDASTEDLRQRFQRYRAFFDRLLAF
jgi:hypothetical protein